MSKTEGKTEISYTGVPKDFPQTKILYYDYGAKEVLARKKEDDAGMDVRFFGFKDEEGNFIEEDYILTPGEVVKIPLGFGLGIPYGTMMMILPRSGHSAKGITSLLPPGDTGYTGEMHCMLANLSTEPYVIEVGERIAQLVIVPIITNTVLVETNPEDIKTERGNTGFNASGKF